MYSLQPDRQFHVQSLCYTMSMQQYLNLARPRMARLVSCSSCLLADACPQPLCYCLALRNHKHIHGVTYMAHMHMKYNIVISKTTNLCETARVLLQTPAFVSQPGRPLLCLSALACHTADSQAVAAPTKPRSWAKSIQLPMAL